VIITKHIEYAELNQPFIRLLMSDLHIGSINSDHDAIVSDLQRAKDIGARVLVNGDVFDAIGPKDKRYDLVTLHPSVARAKDLAKAIVDMAKEILSPFASIIDVMGIGNHEEAWINYNHSDPVRRLIEELNKDGGRIVHGSFWGYINTHFQVLGYRKRAKHKLLYLHGTGGDSPVTKGTIDFNRKGRSWQYDTLTFGHKHNIVCSVEQIGDVSDRGRYSERRQLNLQTGSYYRNYRQLTDAECLDYSYAARGGHPPKPIGGLFLTVRPVIDANGELSIKQDFASDIVVPWTKKPAKKAS
jgi:hypothetical protein